MQVGSAQRAAIDEAGIEDIEPFGGQKLQHIGADGQALRDGAVADLGHEFGRDVEIDAGFFRTLIIGHGLFAMSWLCRFRLSVESRSKALMLSQLRFGIADLGLQGFSEHTDILRASGENFNSSPGGQIAIGAWPRGGMIAIPIELGHAPMW